MAPVESRDGDLSDRQLKRRGEFIRAVTFWKPYSVLTDTATLAKSGLNLGTAKTVVTVSFSLSLGLMIPFAFLVLRLLGSLADAGFGFAFYLALLLVFHFVVAHYSALILVRYFKNRMRNR